FMEDWGPSSPQANAASAKVNRTKHCNAGIVQTIAFPDQHEVELWIERKDKTIGYTPWPVPRQKVPEPVLWAFDQFGPCNMR
ncbi:MAG: hypothetical protein H7Y20_05570, partial [Bryobacteraceae bacterium]|nr:hypothetical protein [Bryobacteraceae bacterium]